MKVNSYEQIVCVEGEEVEEENPEEQKILLQNIVGTLNGLMFGLIISIVVVLLEWLIRH